MWFNFTRHYWEENSRTVRRLISHTASAARDTSRVWLSYYLISKTEDTERAMDSELAASPSGVHFIEDWVRYHGST